MIPCISVIIPVHNAELYLSRCMDSVISQTLKSIEIICINDASSDFSGEVLRSYASDDSRINVIELDFNVGESAARNIGLKIARGEYIGSVDNDDFIDSNFFEKLYIEAKRLDFDIVKANCIEIMDNSGEHILRYINNQIRKNKFCFSHQWWTAIYRRTLITDNNIIFPENLCLGGDIVFLLKALIYSNSISIIDDIFYYHYKRDDSGDSKILPTRKVESLIDTHEQIFTLLNDHYPIHITSKEYELFYRGHFRNFANNIPSRCEKKSDQEKCAKAVIKFSQMCKHPDMLKTIKM